MTVALPAAFDRRFVVVSGKGGVGKSTLAAAIGMAAASAGRKTCIVQLNTRDAIGPIFLGAPTVGYEPTRLDARLPLWSVNLRPDEALREYSLMKLRFRTLHKIVFENEVMRRMLRMLPGVTETLLLGKAWFMEAMERDEQGAPRWDVLVIDAPSTGHGISLLRLPEVLLSMVPVGPMADDARQMRALLVDPERTAFHIATLPSELPVNEALDLAREAQTSIGIPTGWMIANQVLPDLLRPNTAQAMARLPRSDALIAQAVDNGATWLQRRAAQQEQLLRLVAASPIPVIETPHRLAAIDVAATRWLAESLVASARAQALATASGAPAATVGAP